MSGHQAVDKLGSVIAADEVGDIEFFKRSYLKIESLDGADGQVAGMKSSEGIGEAKSAQGIGGEVVVECSGAVSVRA